MKQSFGHSTTHSGNERANGLLWLCFKGCIVKILTKTIANVVKPNKCNQCGYASSHTGNLRRRLKRHSGEKSNKCNLCDSASSQEGHLRTQLKTHSGEKVNQKQLAWLCLFSGRLFNETFENPHVHCAQWRKVKQMQPMRLCIFTGRWFEETFKNAHWRKVKKMQPVWLCILSGKPFEDTLENKHLWFVTNVTFEHRKS